MNISVDESATMVEFQRLEQLYHPTSERLDSDSANNIEKL
jgi:hypothetical protein